jgi:hypothetical protein
MKILRIITLLLMPCCFVSAQSWEMGSQLTFSQPVSGMKRDMSNAIGMSFDFGRQLKNIPFTIGTELSLGNYGTQNSRQEYTFDDGTRTETNVHVNNNITNLRLTGRYFLRSGKKFNPYVSGKAGWSWFTTRLTIDDPEDVDGCTPLVNDVLQRDNTYSLSAGAGARLDFSMFFKNMPSNRFAIDMSVHAVQGGRVQYMNVHQDSKSTPPQSDVMASFINTRTQVIHQHHVGYVYTNMLNMVEYRLGVICKFGE